MADQFSTPLNVIEFPRATLFVQAPGMENDRSSMNFSMLNENPRITVWTRVDDKDKGPIQAGIGQEYIKGIFGQIKTFFESDIVDTLAFDNLKPSEGEDGRPGERVIRSTFMAGRDEEGLCFYSLTSSDDSRPKIIFPFRGMEWHKPRRRSTPFSPRELSTIHAVSWTDYIERCFNGQIKGQTPEERKAISEARKARRGGGSYNRGGGGNFQSKPSQQNRVAVDLGDTSDFAF